MKTRIKEITDSQGTSVYWIQEKYWFMWWNTGRWFMHLEDAKNHLAYKQNVKITIYTIG